MREKTKHDRLGSTFSQRRSLTYVELQSLSGAEVALLTDAYEQFLQRRSPEERLRLYRRGQMTRCETWIWARSFPGEIPLVNDEFEWIALEGDG